MALFAKRKSPLEKSSNGLLEPLLKIFEPLYGLLTEFILSETQIFVNTFDRFSAAIIPSEFRVFFADENPKEKIATGRAIFWE